MHDDARPWWVEQEAISRAVLFARETGARLYICHMTIAQGAAFLKQAKFEGVNVSVETCPHYLLFDKTILRERGAYAKCNPPFRSRENVEKLWSYILDGTIDTLGSDHGPYRDDEKVQAGDFWKEYSVSQRIIALSCLVFLFLFFSCFGKNFLTKNSMVSLLESVHYIICLAFGMTFVISTGGIDLSIGSVAMCGALIGGVSYNEWHMPIWAALIITVLVTTVFGVLNGFLVSCCKIPPFVATMGTQYLAQGIRLANCFPLHRSMLAPATWDMTIWAH